tara:strand:+ start:434 stop:1081 length:648 start_codon:yes stop_codon:yes gene_type:complete
MITIALTKGRILKEILPVLSSVGIETIEDVFSSRKLLFKTTNADIDLLILRGTDVLTYTQFGVADIGIVGKDMLLEHGSNQIYELYDLGIARCKLMTAREKNKNINKPRISVATKYVNVAKRYYATLGIQADIIKLYGGMELAPITGLADEIVDIVDTGQTLAANGLEQINFIADISSRLIVNEASFKVNNESVKAISKIIFDFSNKKYNSESND